jgi:hypothetical protein
MNYYKLEKLVFWVHLKSIIELKKEHYEWYAQYNAIYTKVEHIQNAIYVMENYR